MEIQARKNVLIQWLAQLQDARMIQVLESIKALEEDQQVKSWDSLTQAQENGLDEAIESLDRGEFLTYQQVRANLAAKHGI